MNEPFQYYIDTLADRQSDLYLAGLPRIAKLLTLMSDNQVLVSTYPNRHIETRLTPGISRAIGLFNLALVTPETEEILAHNAFNYHFEDNSLAITHTAQGRLMTYLTKEAQRALNKARNFRELIMRDTILLACSLGISQINAINSRNHPKVRDGIISLERAQQIIDKPLLATGFIEGEDRNDYYDCSNKNQQYL